MEDIVKKQIETLKKLQ